MDRCASLMYRVGCCPLLDRELTLRVVGFEDIGVGVAVGVEDVEV